MAEKQTRLKRLATNTFVFTIGKFVSKLLVLFMTPLYTACLSPEEYTSASLVTNVANLLIPIFAVGMGEGIFRYAAEKARNKEKIFTTGLILLGIGSLLLCGICPLIRFIPVINTSKMAVLIGVYVLSSNLHTVVSQYLCAVGHTKLFAAQGVLNTALTIGFNILFLPILKTDYTGYVLSVVLADFVTTLFLIFYRKVWRCVVRVSRHEFSELAGEMLKFSVPMIPATVCWWITNVSDQYLVTYLRSAEENGIYTIAYKIPTLLTYAVGVFDSAWKLSAVQDTDNREELTNYYSDTWQKYLSVFFIGGCLLVTLSKPFSLILLSDSYHYRDAVIYIPVLACATVCYSLDMFLGSVYFAGKKTVWSMISAFLGAGINVVLNLIMIPEYGAMGAAVATLVSYAIILLVRLLTVRSVLKFRLRPLQIIVNTVLLTASAAAITVSYGYPKPDALPVSGTVCFLAGVALAIVLILCNLRCIIAVMRDILSLFRRRSKSGDEQPRS